MNKSFPALPSDTVKLPSMSVLDSTSNVWVVAKLLTPKVFVCSEVLLFIVLELISPELLIEVEVIAPVKLEAP